MSGLPELQEGDTKIIEQLRHPLDGTKNPEYNQALLTQLTSVGLITVDTALRVKHYIEEAVDAPKRARNAEFAEREKQKDAEILQTQLREAGELIEAKDYEGMLVMMRRNNCPPARYLREEPKRMLVKSIMESNTVDHISRMMEFVYEDDYLEQAMDIVIKNATVEQLAQAVIHARERIGRCEDIAKKFLEVSGGEHFGLYMPILEKLNTRYNANVAGLLISRLISSEEGITCFVEHFKTKEQGSSEQRTLIQHAGKPGRKAVLLKCIDEAHIDTKPLQSEDDNWQLVLDVIRTRKRFKQAELPEDLEQKVAQLMDTITPVMVTAPIPLPNLDQNEVMADINKLVAQMDMQMLEIYLNSIKEYVEGEVERWLFITDYKSRIEPSFVDAMRVLDEVKVMIEQ